MGKKKKHDRLQNKKLIYTIHVRKRMLKRGVDKKTIYYTLQNPCILLPKLPNNTQKFMRKINKKTHYVVVEHKPKVIIIVTTGWL